MVRGQSERKPQQPEEMPDIVDIIYSPVPIDHIRLT